MTAPPDAIWVCSILPYVDVWELVEGYARTCRAARRQCHEAYRQLTNLDVEIWRPSLPRVVMQRLTGLQRLKCVLSGRLTVMAIDLVRASHKSLRDIDLGHCVCSSELKVLFASGVHCPTGVTKLRIPVPFEPHSGSDDDSDVWRSLLQWTAPVHATLERLSMPWCFITTGIAASSMTLLSILPQLRHLTVLGGGCLSTGIPSLARDASPLLESLIVHDDHTYNNTWLRSDLPRDLPGEVSALLKSLRTPHLASFAIHGSQTIGTFTYDRAQRRIVLRNGLDANRVIHMVDVLHQIPRMRNLTLVLDGSCSATRYYPVLQYELRRLQPVDLCLSPRVAESLLTNTFAGVRHLRFAGGAPLTSLYWLRSLESTVTVHLRAHLDVERYVWTTVAYLDRKRQVWQRELPNGLLCALEVDMTGLLPTDAACCESWAGCARSASPF